jgi:hypothetical protein
MEMDRKNATVLKKPTYVFTTYGTRMKTSKNKISNSEPQILKCRNTAKQRIKTE